MAVKERRECQPVIVDRCWSLLPLSLISAVIAAIFFKNAALFYVAFMEEFNISHQSAIWPSNLTSMTQHSAGLLINLLQRRLSLYHIMILGCLLNSASLVASAFVPNITWMTITAGIINGLGIGMGALSLSLYAMTYFDKYRATASGYKYAGMGLVQLIFPLAISAALREYGLRGTLLLLAAVTLNLIPIAILMKTPKPMSLSCKKQARTDLKKADSPSYDIEMHCTKKSGPPQAPPAFSNTSIASADQFQHVQKAETVGSDTTTSISSKKTGSHMASTSCSALPTSGANIKNRIPTELANVTSEEKRADKDCVFDKHKDGNTDYATVCSLELRFKKGPEESTCFKRNLAINNQSKEETLVIEDTPNHVEGSLLNLLKNPTFYLLILTFTVAEYTQQTFETTVFDYAMDKGIARSQAEPIITYVAAAEILGQLTLPFFWDSCGLRRSILAALCLLAEAVCFVAMPHAKKSWEVLVAILALSFPMGCLLLLKPVLLSDHMGVRTLAACWGMAAIAMLPFAFGMPFLIGVFRDTMGSYDNLYRTISALCAILGVFMLFFAFSETRLKRHPTKITPHEGPR
ncbi:monocarboxylate transporter 9-like [Haemaphysalis longicornis]